MSDPAKRLFRFLVGAAGLQIGLSVSMIGQTSSASISGVVTGADGSSIGGAHVFAGPLSTASKLKAPPTLLASVTSSVYAKPDGSFTLANLTAGSYILCAEASIPGWLDPCHFASAVAPVTVAAGKATTGQNVVLSKGAVLQVRINDPGQLLANATAVIAHDVEVLVRASNNGYYESRIVSTDSTGRNHEITVPFDLQQTLIVRSQGFTLKNSAGAAVPPSGFSQTVQVATGAVAPSFTFTVSGKSN